MREILLFALAAAPVLCAASDWQKVAATDNSAYLMDFDSIVPADGYRKAWMRIGYFTEQKTDNYHQKIFRSQKQLFYFDCKARSLTLVQSISYEGVVGNGDVVESFTWKFDPKKLADFIPDSIGEAMSKAACGSTAERLKIKRANLEESKKLMEELGKKYGSSLSSESQ
jgi:hypothetical protein